MSLTPKIVTGTLAATALFAAGLACSSDTEARTCQRGMSKTGGTVVGAVGGAILGGVLTHGSTGPLLGAAAGGVAGHEMAGNNRNCRVYRRHHR